MRALERRGERLVRLGDVAAHRVQRRLAGRGDDRRRQAAPRPRSSRAPLHSPRGSSRPRRGSGGPARRRGARAISCIEIGARCGEVVQRLLDRRAQEQHVGRRRRQLPPPREDRLGAPEVARVAQRACALDLGAGQRRPRARRAPGPPRAPGARRPRADRAAGRARRSLPRRRARTLAPRRQPGSVRRTRPRSAPPQARPRPSRARMPFSPSPHIYERPRQPDRIVRQMAATFEYDFDYVVVGSGFGGSVSACRLAEKGYSVAVDRDGQAVDRRRTSRRRRGTCGAGSGGRASGCSASTTCGRSST